MRISLSPMRRDDRLEASVMGDVLSVNGEAFDFSALPEGASLPREAMASDWFAGPVERIGGTLHLALIVPHGANAPEATRFPAPISAGDGPVTLPPSGSPEDKA